MAEFQIVVNIDIPDGHAKEEKKRLLGEAQDAVCNGLGHRMSNVENQSVVWVCTLQKRTPPGSTYLFTDVNTIDEALGDE